MKLTTAIISKNGRLSKRTMDMINFSDEIVIVVDSCDKIKPTQNGTVNIFYHPLEQDYSQQRNYALERSHGDWVLFIDEDEYLSPALKKEIKAMINKTKYTGFYIPRIDVCYHQPLLHGESGQTLILRLAKKEAGKFFRPVHEIWRVKGKIGKLSSTLYHIKDHFVSEFIDRMSFYSEIDAQVLAAENKPFTKTRLFLNPIGKFLLNYFGKKGYQDYLVGLFYAYLMSTQSLTIRIFQWIKRNQF